MGEDDSHYHRAIVITLSRAHMSREHLNIKLGALDRDKLTREHRPKQDKSKKRKHNNKRANKRSIAKEKNRRSHSKHREAQKIKTLFDRG